MKLKKGNSNNANKRKASIFTLLQKLPRRGGRSSPAYIIGLIILFITLSVLSSLRKGDERTVLSSSTSSSMSGSNSNTCRSQRSGPGRRHSNDQGTCNTNYDDNSNKRNRNADSGKTQQNRGSCRNGNCQSMNGDGSNTNGRKLSTSSTDGGTKETTVKLETGGNGADLFSVSVETEDIGRAYNSDISVENILDLDMEVKISWASTDSNDSKNNNGNNRTKKKNNVNNNNNNNKKEQIRVQWQGQDGVELKASSINVVRNDKKPSLNTRTPPLSSSSSSSSSSSQNYDSVTINAEHLLGTSSMRDNRGHAIFSSSSTIVTAALPTSSTTSASSNKATNKIKQPRYFITEKISKQRIKKEIKYYRKHSNTWSQRVILEMMYNQILGTNIDASEDIQKEIDDKWTKANQDQEFRQKQHQKKKGNDNIIEIDDVIRKAILQFGLVKHPLTQNAIYYRRKINLYGWGDDEVHECDWEGVACGEDNYRKKMAKYAELEYSDKRESSYVLEYKLRDCFCIEQKLWDVWNYDANDYIRDESSNDSDSSTNRPCKCGDGKVLVNDVPDGFVTHMVLDSEELVAGPLPETLAMLPFLKKLYIKGGTFIGSIPTTFGSFQNLNDLHLEGFDFLKQGIPNELGMLNHTLESLTVRSCNLQGSIPETITRLSSLVRLDLRSNNITGKFPKHLSNLKHLSYLDLGKNNIKGNIPSSIGKLSDLRFFNAESNALTGTLPDECSKWSQLETLSLSSNSFEGSLRDSLGNHPQLKVVEIAMNKVRGRLSHIGWSKDMEIIDLRGNNLTGPLPEELLQSSSLLLVDLSHNLFTGTIPSLGSNLTKLSQFYLSSNFLIGNISTLGSLPDLTSIRIGDNRLTGEVSERFCNGMDGSEVVKKYPVPFNCTDFLACPPGTFHPDGVANHVSGCMKCPPCSSERKIPECAYIGQTQCVGIIGDNDEIVRGDMNADGVLSQREFLRLFYMLTGGNSWGEQYSNWRDMSVHACALTGINCKGGMVTKIDLRGATLCLSSKNCEGIPSEISALGESLEVLDLSKSFPRSEIGGSIGNIPSSIGMLSRLKILDLSHNIITGIPDEIGNISTLQMLNLSKCNFGGSIPSAIWKLESLEKLNLNDNMFGQTFPPEVGRLTNLRELLISVSHLEGTIPPELGNLSKLKNLEFYSNFLVGTIPSTFENFTQLRRMDIFNNQLEGTVDFIPKIPEFEIVHVRMNKFSGTIPEAIGNLKKLAWLDISINMLSGEIPSSLASIPVLKDLHLGENRLQPPVPSSLCQKSQINGGFNAISSCDHIICPIGTFSKQGYAVSDSPCQPCEKEKTTLHIGSKNCLKMAAYEYSSMLDSLVYKRDYNYDNNKGDECDLDVVVCDKSGNILGFNIPLAAMEFNEKLFQA